ncbi:hypothetical protein SRHO_G00068960 [Serrasalmus rhombeus]
MSYLWFWCCRGQQSDSDTENKAHDEQLKSAGKIKKKKKWRTRQRKEQQKKEKTKEVQRAEESQASPQPAEGEKESEAPHIPAGYVSGSLDNISAVIPENTGTPLYEDFLTSEDIPEASSNLRETSLVQIEAEAKAKDITPLVCTDPEEQEADNNQALGDEMFEAILTEAEVDAVKQLMLLFVDKIEAESLGGEVMNATDTEPEAPTLNMQSYLDEVDTPNDHPLEDEMFEAALTEAEVEAVKQLMLHFVDKIEAESLDVEKIFNNLNNLTEIQLDETAVKQALGKEVMTDSEPIKSWADFIDETGGTVDQSEDEMFEAALTEAEVEAVKQLMLHFVDKIEAESLDVEKIFNNLNNLTEIQLDEIAVKQALGKEVMTDSEPIKSWADFIDETGGTVDQSEDEMFEAALTEAEVEAVKQLMLHFVDKIEAESLDVEKIFNNLNNLTEIQLDETAVKQALGKEVMTDSEPIKSWADFIDETGGTVDQSAEIKPLKNNSPGNEAKTNQQKRKTRRGTRGKGRRINYKRDQDERKSE